MTGFFAALLCGKKGMFSLNEGTRFVMAQHPSDMRMGAM